MITQIKWTQPPDKCEKVYNPNFRTMKLPEIEKLINRKDKKLFFARNTATVYIK